jgi:hypothetical protein
VVESGADPGVGVEAVGSQWTGVHSRYLEVVRLLMEAGANVQARDVAGL